MFWGLPVSLCSIGKTKNIRLYRPQSISVPSLFSSRPRLLPRAQVEILADISETEREGGWMCKAKTSLQRNLPGIGEVKYGLTLHDSGLTLGSGWFCPSFDIPLTREVRDVQGATHAAFNRRSAEFEVRDRKGNVLATVPTTQAGKAAAVAAMAAEHRGKDKQGKSSSTDASRPAVSRKRNDKSSSNNPGGKPKGAWKTETESKTKVKGKAKVNGKADSGKTTANGKGTGKGKGVISTTQGGTNKDAADATGSRWTFWGTSA